MARFVEIDEIVSALAALTGERRVFLPMGPAEPLALAAALRARPAAARGMSFVGAPLSGINETDWTLLGDGARFEATMLCPALAQAFRRGAVRLRPMHWSQIPAFLRALPVDAAIALVAAPSADGSASLGLSADLTPSAFEGARLRIALVNPAIPDVAGAPRIALAACNLVAEAPFALAHAATDHPSAEHAAIAARVAVLVNDGDVIQTGIGRLPGAILARLTERRGLRVHSGLLGSGHADLIEAGAIADEPGALTAGTIVADEGSARRIAADSRLRLVPVDETHDVRRLACIPRLKALNAALEVDLFGQFNAEFAGVRQIAGVGGLADFVRGASLSPDGRAIIALTASGKEGASRVVARLAGPVTLARADAVTIVTEFGIADLRGLDIDGRADALIAVAPPGERDRLRKDFADLRARL
jgi:acyl-CoA hydrolase